MKIAGVSCGCKKVQKEIDASFTDRFFHFLLESNRSLLVAGFLIQPSGSYVYQVQIQKFYKV